MAQADAATSYTFTAALNDKYDRNDEELDFVIFVPKSAPGKKDGKLVLPRQLSLIDMQVSAAGDTESVREQCANITGLDLSGNCLSWDEIFRLMGIMPSLDFLNLSFNPLQGAPIPETDCFTQLRTLILNSTKIRWSETWRLLKYVPNLRELYLSLNDHKTVDLPEEGATFPSIREIIFSDNGVTDWRQAALLVRVFPSLCSLTLERNHIATLGDPAEWKDHFSGLERLNLIDNDVTEWCELEKIRYMGLKSVKTQGLPLLKPYEEKLARQLLVAYLPGLSLLNGSAVGEAERVTAERVFLRHFMDSAQKPPRYEELRAVHGDLDPFAEVNLTPEDDATIRVHRFGKSILMKVDLKWTLMELKQRLTEFSGLPVKLIRLFHDEAGEVPRYCMTYNQRPLYSYRVKEGDDIYLI